MMDCPAVTIVDGDTIRCGSERIRLLGIDAPEIHGYRKGRTCVPGDGQASKRVLSGMLRGSIKIVRVKQDRYGRTVAVVYANGLNLSCQQLVRGMAHYIGRWDHRGRIAHACPGLAR
jgi:endonuclease YncB( thermonuclease family)